MCIGLCSEVTTSSDLLLASARESVKKEMHYSAEESQVPDTPTVGKYRSISSIMSAYSCLVTSAESSVVYI